MKRFHILILTCGITLSQIKAQTPTSSPVDSLIIWGIDQTFNSQFDSALTTFQKLIDLHPNHIMGYFYKAAALQFKLLDYETDLWEEEYDDLIEEAIRLGKNQIREGDDDPWIYYYVGNCYGYKGLYQAKHGKFITGFLIARNGLDFMKKALERNQTLYDAYLIVGSYKYWYGRFSKYLNWLPMIHDEREEGIQMVKLAMDKGKFSYWVGLNNLAWIEYDRKNYESAKDLFSKGLVKYPNSRFFLWGVGDTSYRLEDYVAAVEIYEAILVSLQNLNENSDYNEIVCRFKLVQTYLGQKNFEKALLHCNVILNKKVDEDVAKRIQSRREKTEEYQKQCIQHLHQTESD
ncbi:tetratricopeptide repeat protein [bacterium]|nr:tetratricopeptide repeat protein [bacterium]RQV98039.1 MAG: tetratricopeptide repeat protein [bacterium]